MSLCPNKPKAEQAEKPTPCLRFFREVKSQDKPFPTLERQADRENYTLMDQKPPEEAVSEQPKL